MIGKSKSLICSGAANTADSFYLSHPLRLQVRTVAFVCVVDDGARSALTSSIRIGLKGRQTMRFRRSHRSSSSSG